MDKVPHDQEIIHIPHGMDNIQFILQTPAQGSVIIRITPLHPLITEFIQVSPGIVTFRDFKLGKLGNPELNLHIAPFRNLVGIVKGFLGIGKQSPHLILGFTVILAAFVAHPIFIGDLFSCLDTQKDIVGRGILSISIVNVIGGHQINIQFL